MSSASRQRIRAVAAEHPAAVVLAILDAFPFEQVGAALSPNLWSLAAEGGRAALGGIAELVAATYPNHATFVTGARPEAHGILTNNALEDGAFRPAQEVGPTAQTLFDDCREAGRRAVAVFGDQNLVGVCGAREADAHWPPGGVLPDDAPRGKLGYGADRAVVDALDEVGVSSAELVVVQFDEVDTVRHLHGPDAVESREQCHATDAAFGELLKRVRARWDDTVVIALSDHDQEAVTEGAIDLAAETRARGLDVIVDHEGTACVVVGEVEETVLLDLPGITGASSIGTGYTAVWGDAGTQFGIDWGLKAQHGSPRTVGQLAVVGGGHPAAAEVAKEITGSRPPATLWAGLIRDLLGLTTA